jgi:serine/threonine-protein kinase
MVDRQVDSPSSSLPLVDGKYQLVRQLGQGGMGAVYEARHTGTGRRVAVKLIAGASMQRNAEVVARFQREAMASGAIESQHIAQILDTGVDPTTGSPYTVMELLSGEDLEQALTRLGPLAPDVALRITAQACQGLRKAHEACVVHRDIKPANLFLVKGEEGEVVVKLLDFGIAKVKADEAEAPESGSLTRTGSMIGSPVYMSPEQARGKKEIDHRTDVWSLGVVLYEALAGRTPHGHIDAVGELIFQICSVPAPPVQDHAPWVPAQVAAIVHRALALDPAQRFQSAREMGEAIRAQLRSGSTLAESMFVPLSGEARAVAAPKFELTSGMRARSPSDVGVEPGPLSSGAVSGSTAMGLEFAEKPPLPRSRRGWVLGSVALGMAAIGALTVVRLVPSRKVSEPAMASAPPSAMVAAAIATPAPAVVTLPPVDTGAEAGAASASATPTTPPPVPTVPRRPAPAAPAPATAAAPASTSTSSMHMEMK